MTRPPLSTRLPPEAEDAIRAHARINGRTPSAEIAARLIASLEPEDAKRQALAAELAMLVERTMADLGRIRDALWGGFPEAPADEDAVFARTPGQTYLADQPASAAPRATGARKRKAEGQ